MEAKHSKHAAGKHAGGATAPEAAEEPREGAPGAEEPPAGEEPPAAAHERRMGRPGRRHGAAWQAAPGEPVRHLDGKGLARPLDPPLLVRRGMLAFAAVAVAVGGVMLFQWVDRVYLSPADEQQALQQNLTREVSLDLPVLAALAPLDDAAIMQSLADAGNVLYERTPVGQNPDGGFDVVKLPADVPLEEAGLLYLQGINNISPASAAKLLNGSWDLEVSRKAGTVLRLHYADFASGDADGAIFAAMESQGLDSTMVTDSGVDDAGNTYQAGTTPEGYGWRVSVIGLSEVYKLSGLPATAQYVGIRLTA